MTSLSLQTGNFPVPDFPATIVPEVACGFRSQEAERWDLLIREHPGGASLYQIPCKRIVERTFDHRTQYVFGERDERIAAVTYAIKNRRNPKITDPDINHSWAGARLRQIFLLPTPNWELQLGPGAASLCG